MTVRSGAIGLGLAVIVALGAPAAGGRAAHAARAARPSDLLPKPPNCTAKGATADFCVLTTVLGTLQLRPHIVRPGGIIRGRIIKFSCTDLILPRPCPISWQPTGPGQASGVGAWLKQISRCGTKDRTCSWRVSRQAPTTRYGLIGLSISKPNALGDFSGTTTDYVGILGPKPPPPLPKPTGPPVVTPPPVILPPPR